MASISATPSRLKNLSEIEQRSVGCVLTGIIGDILGAPLEGMTRRELREYHGGIVSEFLKGEHMGVPRELRKGRYTDDTNAMLALASSLTRKKGLNGWDIAHCNVEFYCLSAVLRGCPSSAQRILKALLNGADYSKTGSMVFQDGSYANGGTMRIGPIGIVFRNATDLEMRAAVTEAVKSTHVNPEAIDGAFLVAKAVSLLLKYSPNNFDPIEFLSSLEAVAEHSLIKEKLVEIAKQKDRFSVEPIKDVASGGWNHFSTKDAWKIDDLLLNSVSDIFQLRTSDAVATTIWGFLRYWREPEACLEAAVGFGGDTDTIATICGYLIGALYGCEWIPERWWSNIENEKWGRDYAVDISIKLAELDERAILEPKADLTWSIKPVHIPSQVD